MHSNHSNFSLVTGALPISANIRACLDNSSISGVKVSVTYFYCVSKKSSGFRRTEKLRFFSCLKTASTLMDMGNHGRSYGVPFTKIQTLDQAFKNQKWYILCVERWRMPTASAPFFGIKTRILTLTWIKQLNRKSSIIISIVILIEARTMNRWCVDVEHGGTQAIPNRMPSFIIPLKIYVNFTLKSIQ